jgi:hypothetical protein
VGGDRDGHHQRARHQKAGHDAAQEQGEEELTQAVSTLENKPAVKSEVNYIPYIIGGAAIIYLISKKRK